MALKEPYCTIQEADTYLADNATWLSLFESQKTQHLLNGRYYIDSMYRCSGVDTDVAIPDEYKYANAKLGEADMQNSIYTVSETGNIALTLKTVKAGSVTSTKEYSRYRGNGVRNYVDNFPFVTSLLSEYCTLSGGRAGNIQTAQLIRS